MEESKLEIDLTGKKYTNQLDNFEEVGKFSTPEFLDFGGLPELLLKAWVYIPSKMRGADLAVVGVESSSFGQWSFPTRGYSGIFYKKLK